MPIIQLENVRKSYHLGKTLVPAIKGVSFSIDEGDFVSIIGPSGSGKSTFLRCLNRLEESSGGEILIDGTDIRTRRGAGPVVPCARLGTL